MNTLDLVILGVILISGMFGLFRGFITSVLSLITWVVALWLPFKFTAEFTTFLPDTVESPTARAMIAAACLFFGAFLMLSLISWMLRALLGATGLGFADKLFGFGLGMVRGVVITAMVAMFASYGSTFQKEAWWGESQLLPHVLKISKVVRGQIPDSLANVFSLSRI